MTATEILRRLLDERGVWWDYGIRGATTTRFNANGVDLTFTPMRDGLFCSTILTPEQAIAATLGRSDVGRYVGLRQGEYWERTENSNYYCGGCGWKVTDHDSYCPECGGALHEYALGARTCHMVLREDIRGHAYQDTYECSECGEEVVRETCMGESEPPNYCPNCGRKVVDE